MGVYWEDTPDRLPKEESGNQALQGMGPGTRKLPATVPWSLLSLQFLSNPRTSPHCSPSFSTQIPGRVFASPTICHQAVRGDTSPPKNQPLSGTDFLGASYSFFVTLIPLNSPCHTSPQEDQVSPLNHREACTWSRNKDALHTHWG